MTVIFYGTFNKRSIGLELNFFSILLGKRLHFLQTSLMNFFFILNIYILIIFLI